MMLQRLRHLFGTAADNDCPVTGNAARYERLAILHTRREYHWDEAWRITEEITKIMSEPVVARMREAGLP